MEENQENQKQPYESFAHRHHHSTESIITLLEWLLVAFILALVFQGFGMQAFQIPTGSMAETLRGAHYQFRCFRCGYAFDAGNGAGSFDRPQCPNCNYLQPPSAFGPIKNGDRIFVLKCIYQFFEPKHWDVVVFKNPVNPRENFIKRLIALPGETVQLIDGDLYIDGIIQRKPLNVQRELWMPIFIQDFGPGAAADFFNMKSAEGQDTHNGPWQQPFQNEPGSIWDMHPGHYVLRVQTGKRHVIAYKTDNSNEFRATYAYNGSAANSYRPVCTDLMITFYARGQNPDGYIGASLEKFGVLYSARVDFAGTLRFTQTIDGVTTPIGHQMQIQPIPTGIFKKFEFANVDHQLILHWDDKRFAYDLSNDTSFMALDKHDDQSPRVKIFAVGSTEVRHVGLYRDIYYMGQEDSEAVRATENRPFKLDPDQFFVCGDNCNDSLDARVWKEKGKGNNGKTYRTGTVPREYLMGKAVMVYWSQAFKPQPPEGLQNWIPELPPIVPNLGNLKLIYGGSEQLY